MIAAILVGSDGEVFIPAVAQGIGSTLTDIGTALLFAIAGKDEMTHDSVTIISTRPSTTASTGQGLLRAMSRICRSVASRDAVIPLQPRDA